MFLNQTSFFPYRVQPFQAFGICAVGYKGVEWSGVEGSGVAWSGVWSKAADKNKKHKISRLSEWHTFYSMSFIEKISLPNDNIDRPVLVFFCVLNRTGCYLFFMFPYKIACVRFDPFVSDLRKRVGAERLEINRKQKKCVVERVLYFLCGRPPG